MGGPCHTVEYMSKALRHVTRSTFSSELLAACDSVDLGLLIITLLHELEKGPITCTKHRELRENGGFSMHMTLSIDAQSVYAAITALALKAPAEKGLLAHVQFIRELLDNGVLSALNWIDTRDMAADGLTKGAVDRDQLHDVMDGTLKFNQSVKTWSPKVTKAIQQATIAKHSATMAHHE